MPVFFLVAPLAEVLAATGDDFIGLFSVCVALTAAAGGGGVEGRGQSDRSTASL